jgi:hypothetical protein
MCTHRATCGKVGIRAMRMASQIRRLAWDTCEIWGSCEIWGTCEIWGGCEIWGSCGWGRSACTICRACHVCVCVSVSLCMCLCLLEAGVRARVHT